MGRVAITVLNNFPVDSFVTADGRELKFEKDKKRGVSETSFTAEKEETEIKFSAVTQSSLPFGVWILQTAFFWLISLFGIFDSVPNKRCRAFSAIIKLKTTGDVRLKIKFRPFMTGKEVLEITESDAETELSENKYFIDKTARRRVVGYRIWKWLSIFAAAICAAFWLINN